MAYFLDTNTCIDALKGTRPGIQERMRARAPREIKIPAIVKAELLLGGVKSARRKDVLAVLGAFLFPYEVVAFADEAAQHYARIRAELERKGTPIGPNDLILAATVLAEAGVLVTRNTRELRRVPGLSIEDWSR
jgi:tRNA(fMet)-specific endonuclease VapC